MKFFRLSPSRSLRSYRSKKAATCSLSFRCTCGPTSTARTPLTGSRIAAITGSLSAASFFAHHACRRSLESPGQFGVTAAFHQARLRQPAHIRIFQFVVFPQILSEHAQRNFLADLPGEAAVDPRSGRNSQRRQAIREIGRQIPGHRVPQINVRLQLCGVVWASSLRQTGKRHVVAAGI